MQIFSLAIKVKAHLKTSAQVFKPIALNTTQLLIELVSQFVERDEIKPGIYNQCY